MSTEMSIEEIRKYYIEMLDEVVRVCHENGLTYFLQSGTLLGAIRHGGFIPWDDDIDLSMPRPDFEKLVELADSFRTDYELQWFTTVKHYAYPYIKIRDRRTIKYPQNSNLYIDPEEGLDIDIFPIDGFFNSVMASKIYFKLQRFIFSKVYVRTFTNRRKTYSNQREKIYIRLFTTIISPETGAKLVNWLAKRNDYRKKTYAGISVALYRGKMERVKKVCYTDTLQWKFEGKEYYIPKGYKEVLCSVLGPDYMVLPPEDKRKSTHDCKIYLKIK